MLLLKSNTTRGRGNGNATSRQRVGVRALSVDFSEARPGPVTPSISTCIPPAQSSHLVAEPNHVVPGDTSRDGYEMASLELEAMSASSRRLSRSLATTRLRAGFSTCDGGLAPAPSRRCASLRPGRAGLSALTVPHASALRGHLSRARRESGAAPRHRRRRPAEGH